ncbi:bile acid:sodium symporter [Lysinibacter sp. HNR]|uniref:bile acid:sodium symporter n=1 Tax=Lysinibacter sp. HNR TaxID=3031408 RepID=UPI002435ED54|nr:bile acid:sodium symporter [Lysinibacter sp. HNR]WGD37669.1 bile acid:sodium symporter [Lysinibacter sp. HNR]
MSFTSLIQWSERRQITLYLGAIGVGGVAGFLAPETAVLVETTITPLLAVLLFFTFLGIPLLELRASLRDARFLSAVLVLNFVMVPMLVWIISFFVRGNTALLVGVVLVLVTPCVDYVIVFAGLARGNASKLLAVTPLLMLLQMALLPLYLRLLAGSDLGVNLNPAPFIEAFLLLIVLPLIVAGAVQWATRHNRSAQRLVKFSGIGMIPVMMLTLAAVIWAHIYQVSHQLGELLHVVPIFLGFATAATLLGWGTGTLWRLSVPDRRALLFSGVIRNSLVVLPLALVFSETLALVPLVVVFQTMIEFVVMVILVRLVPRMVRS